VRTTSASLAVLAVVAACAGPAPIDPTDEPSARPTRPGRTASAPPIAPLEFDFAGALPRSADFAGLRFTVDAAHITNYHPYPILNHDPTQYTFGVLDLRVANVGNRDVSYAFGDEAFALRTWSGDVRAEVEHPGSRKFGRLDSGEEATDKIAFGLPDADALDGAVLLIGTPPDSPAFIALSGAEPASEGPLALLPVDPAPVLVTPVSWRLLRGALSLDRGELDIPATASGERANLDEVFVVLSLEGTVSGSQYGQASVTSEGIRLLVDGTEVKPLQTRGKANVPEGQSTEFTLAFLAPSPFESMALQFTSFSGETGSMALEATPIGAGANP
jgi:hypothetical protein